MISAIKAFYLTVTCGYCLQFVTSYPLSLIVMWAEGIDDFTVTGRWFMIATFYLALLALTSSLMYYLYRKQLHMSQLLF